MGGLMDRLADFAQGLALKGKEMADVGKLKLDIKAEERNIKSYKLIIGEYVAGHNLLEHDELVSEHIARIAAAEERIREKEKQIEMLRLTQG